MMTYMMSSYRAGLFDGEPGLNWLRPGWRGLRLYARKARAAIEAGDVANKASMIQRADQLLTLMTGILNTGHGTTLGPALMNIYAALQRNLLRANLNDDIAALDDFEAALLLLDREMGHVFDGALAA
jgi:flagellar biosynthetic protein FliS